MEAIEDKGISEAHARGSIVGAFVADACGALNEFEMDELTDEQMDFCMTMPGGGPWSLNPG